MNEICGCTKSRPKVLALTKIKGQLLGPEKHLQSSAWQIKSWDRIEIDEIVSRKTGTFYQNFCRIGCVEAINGNIGMYS